MARTVGMVGVLLGLAGCSVTMQSAVPSGAVGSPVYYASAESSRPVEVVPTRHVESKPRHVAPPVHGDDEHQLPAATPPVARPTRAGDYRQERVAHQTSTKPPHVPKSGKKPAWALPFTPLRSNGPSKQHTVAVSKK